jgi:hypothetical protein
MSLDFGSPLQLIEPERRKSSDRSICGWLNDAMA